MVRSCVIPSKSVFLLRIIFCSCAIVTTLLWSLQCESELTSLLDQKNSDNTKKAIKVALNKFKDYLKERKIDEDSLAASKGKLATVLRKFYAEARKMNGLPLPQRIVSRRSVICFSLRLRQITDLLALDKSRYFAQLRPIIVKSCLLSGKHKCNMEK